MHNILSRLLLWLEAVTAQPEVQSPLDAMSPRELADLPVSHPRN